MTDVPAEQPTRGVERRSIAANTAYSAALQGISAAFTIGLTLFLVRALPPHGYGLLGLALAVGGLVLLPAEFGIGSAAGRYISQHYDSPETLVEIIGASLRLKVVLTGTTCALLALAAPLIADLWNAPDLVWPLRVVAIVVLAQSAMGVLASILNALGRVDLNLWVFLSESLLETGLAVAIVLAGAGAVGALSARAVGFGIAAAVGYAVVHRVVGRIPLRRKDTAQSWTRLLVRYGGALLVVDSAYALFSQIDIVLIGVFLTTTDVGEFAAPLKFAAFLMLPAGAITSGVAYRMGRRDDWAVEKHSLVRASRFVLIVQGFAIAPLLVWATPMSDVLFGRGRYPASADVLRALVPFIVLSGFGNLFSLTANYLGQASRRVPVALLTVAINTAIDVVLIPRIGVVGGAVGTDVAYAFYAPAHAWICATILGVSLRPLLRPALWVALAATAMGGVLALLGTGHIGVMRIVVGAVAATSVYAIVIVVTGTLTQSERRELLLRLRALSARRRLRPQS